MIVTTPILLLMSSLMEDLIDNNGKKRDKREDPPSNPIGSDVDIGWEKTTVRDGNGADKTLEVHEWKEGIVTCAAVDGPKKVEN
ncbi:hypothetical protein Tco_0369287 [Tanacetum coccineum]